VESESILISPEIETPPEARMPDLALARSAPSSPEATDYAAGVATAAVIDVEEPCEVFSKYTLLIRRAPQNEVVAALEILSPSNKGVGSRLDLDSHLRKRSSYLEAGVSLLEIDALLDGERILPTALHDLAPFDRTAWSAFHHLGSRRLRGWGWDESEPIPAIPWTVEEGLPILVDLRAAMDQACEFNHWEDLARS